MLRFPQIQYPKLDQQDSVVMMGSCFAEHIASRLSRDWIEVNSNPFGVMHNPWSVMRLLERCLSGAWYQKDELFLDDNYFFHYEHHSDLANIDKEGYVLEANFRLKQLKESLQNASHLFLTFGTAWVYTKKGEVVANCHKQPSGLFAKELLDEANLILSYKEVIQKIKSLNPLINIVFTISPVRYIKDGWQENTVSKGKLAAVIYELTKDESCCVYFPVYEFVIDYLRTFEYFEKDQLHPSLLAHEKVYELFINSFFTEYLSKQAEEWNLINSKMNHKSIKPFSSAHLKFKQKLVVHLRQFSSKYNKDVSAFLKQQELEIEKIVSEIGE